MAVNTKSVPGWRRLRLDTLDAVMAEAERCAAADRAGLLTRLGNWSAGTILAHVAAWMNYPYDGYPATVARPPWLVRMIVKPFKNWFLAKGLPRGMKIRGTAQGTEGVDVVSTEEGLNRLRTAVDRLKSTAPTMPNPIFGPLPHQEWIAMNCRHAELHFGYMLPK